MRLVGRGAAEKDLRNIEIQQVPLIIRKFESLVNNPFPPQCWKFKGSRKDYRI